MVTVYHAPNTRSLRVLWTLEELGAPYEARRVQFPPRQREPGYLAINPAGSVPAMIDGSLTLTESLAICEYLNAKHDGALAVAAGEPEHWDYVQWTYYGEASLSPPLGNLVRLARLDDKGAGLQAFEAQVRETYAVRLSALERRLEGREFIVGGRLTLADISNAYALNLAALLGVPSGPAASAYFDRLKARPAFLKAASVE